MTGIRIKKINSFFVEIIIILLFFSIATAVTLKIFSAANIKSRKSEIISKSVITCQNIDTLFSNGSSVEEIIKELFKRNITKNNESLYTFYITDDFKYSTAKTDVNFTIAYSLKDDGSETAVVTISLSDDEIIKTSILRYLPNKEEL